MGGIWGGVGKEVGKRFFFEKKNQKTFMTLGQGRFHKHGAD
jgi:hypothetical protein